MTGWRSAAQIRTLRTIDIPICWPMILSSCSSRGVVMGRREDGAAVRKGAEMCPRPHRVDDRWKSPPSTDAAPRASGKRTLKHPGDGGAPLAGIRTCRQELADRRGWSTFSKARPVSRRTPLWSAGRRLVPRGARGRLRKASHRMVSPAIHRGSRTPPRLPALRSPRGSEELELGRRRTRRRSKNTGGGALAV